MPNGTADQSRSSSLGNGPKSSIGSEGRSLISVNKSGPAAPQPVVASSSTFGSPHSEQGQPLEKHDQLSAPSSLPKSNVQSSSDSVSATSLLGHSGGVISIENEVGHQQWAAEPYQINGNITVFNDNVEFRQSESETDVNGPVNSTQEKNIPSKPNEFEVNYLPETSQIPRLPTREGNLVIRPFFL